jgi:hypothetical protein
MGLCLKVLLCSGEYLVNTLFMKRVTVMLCLLHCKYV